MTRVKLHGRVHLASDDKVTTSKFVKCPEDERWVPLEACKRCEKSTCVDDESVSCEPMKDASVTSRAPESAPITEVMDANVLSVDSRATIDAARRAMDDQGASIAIVVDAGRHAIGVCSRVDIVRRAPNHRVEACMTPFVITLLDQADNPVWIWKLSNALPCRWSGPILAADSSEVATETLEISYEQLVSSLAG